VGVAINLLAGVSSLPCSNEQPNPTGMKPRRGRVALERCAPPPPGRKINKPLRRFDDHNTSVADSPVLMIDSISTLWVGSWYLFPGVAS